MDINVHNQKFTISVPQLEVSKCRRGEVLSITTVGRGSQRFIISNPGKRIVHKIFYGGARSTTPMRLERVLIRGRELKIQIEAGGQIMDGEIIELKTDNLNHLEDGHKGQKESKNGGV